MINQGKWDHYEKFWLMYDKDDFPLDDFDNTQFEVEARKKPRMTVAWSNESISIKRNEYCGKSKRKIKKNVVLCKLGRKCGRIINE